MRSLRPLAVSGSSNLPDYPTPLPDEKDGPSSGLSRVVGFYIHNPTTTNTLLMPDTVAIVGFVGLYRSMGATKEERSACLLGAVLFRRPRQFFFVANFCACGGVVGRGAPTSPSLVPDPLPSNTRRT